MSALSKDKSSLSTADKVSHTTNTSGENHLPTATQPSYMMYAPGTAQGNFYMLPTSSPGHLSVIAPSPQTMLSSLPHSSALTPSAVFPQALIPITGGISQSSMLIGPYGQLLPGLDSQSPLHRTGLQHGTPRMYCVPIPHNVQTTQQATIPALLPQPPSLIPILQQAPKPPLSRPSLTLSALPLTTKLALNSIVTNTQLASAGLLSVSPGIACGKAHEEEEEDEEESFDSFHSEEVPVDEGNDCCTSTPSSVLSLMLSRTGQRCFSGRKNSSSLEKLLTSNKEVKQDDSILSQLQDEPHFMSFYLFFKENRFSSNLKLRILNAEGTSVLRWIEVTQTSSHIHPEIGPIDAARILLSSHGLCKVQLLFPYFKTVCTKFTPTCQSEVDSLLAELSAQHVICPGLPDYHDKYTVLGYHPAHVRVLETPHLKRYDHDNCPVWHIPSNVFSKSTHIVHNMCKHCRGLQNNLVRLAMKACEIDPIEKDSWPAGMLRQRLVPSPDREVLSRRLKQDHSRLITRGKDFKERPSVGNCLSAQPGGTLERDAIQGTETPLNQLETGSTGSGEHDDLTSPTVTSTAVSSPEVFTESLVRYRSRQSKDRSQEEPHDQTTRGVGKRQRDLSSEETDSGSEGTKYETPWTRPKQSKVQNF